MLILCNVFYRYILKWPIVITLFYCFLWPKLVLYLSSKFWPRLVAETLKSLIKSLLNIL